MPAATNYSAGVDKKFQKVEEKPSCQRTNCCYDYSLRRRYRRCYAGRGDRKAILDAWTSELISISFVSRNVLEVHVDDGRGN